MSDEAPRPCVFCGKDCALQCPDAQAMLRDLSGWLNRVTRAFIEDAQPERERAHDAQCIDGDED